MSLFSQFPINIVISPIFYLALIPLLYILRRPFLRLITPQGIPGIPKLPNPSPVTGDIPWLAETGKRIPGMTRIMDEVAKELGPIAQVRIGPLAT